MQTNERYVLQKHKIHGDLNFDDRSGNQMVPGLASTFSIVPAAKPMTKARPFQAMHFKQSTQALDRLGFDT